ncbi:microtubule-associated protein TORTIFOLIA1-like [Iris pallida]|uniref:Microtubule-associated protein TORTIFOLIA1-like n=2 Tax=Iris pallida TaxID=29817 RepID=A0AAX6E0I0_IRIPA|nr:microtubule-associated protein TORTIFOLIA1-like [Iris pallida]
MSFSSSKPSLKKSKSQKQPPPPQSRSVSSQLVAMVELKSRILSSLSKLSDRDTQPIAIADLESTIKNLPSPDRNLPVILNSLLLDPHKESLRLLSLLASTHPSAASPHLPKILSHLLRRLKDPASSSDSSLRDACRDAAGALAAVYIKGDDTTTTSSNNVGLFVKPLLEAAAGEQSRHVQAGAAACLAKVVECGGRRGGGGCGNAGAAAFGKLCPRVCRMLGGQGLLAKGALLSVLASLSQVGAISPQNMPLVLQSIRECLENSDWATRKAAADTLSVLASHSSHLVTDGASSTIAALEACRFDKVKPVRDSIMEALQMWKKLIGKEEDISENPKDGKNCESTDPEEKVDNTKSNIDCRRSESVKDSSSPTDKDSFSKDKGSNISDKAVIVLKKRMPSLTDKEMNPEFFQKLETRNSGDLPVEVVVPRKCQQSSNSQGDEEPNMTDCDSVALSKQNGTVGNESSDSHAHTSASNRNIDKRLGAYNKLQESDDFNREKLTEQRGLRAKESKPRTFDADDRAEQSQRDPSAKNFSRSDVDSSFMSNRGNWLTIQRQLSQLERQQLNLMNMLQDFMGGSHDNMITLENRVRGLERVVEEMARDLSLSSGRRGNNLMLGFEGSPGRSSNKYNGRLHDYSAAKFGRGVDSRIPYAERFLASDSILSGGRGRDAPWRPDSEAWDSYAYASSRNGLMSSRRGLGAVSVDGRSPRTEHDGDEPGCRRAWDEGHTPFRLGEGPSARSVWQASKDEATLEAIRVAGDDNGTSRIAARGEIRELDAEALTDDNSGQERGPLWVLWSRAMDSLHAGDVDSAYAEVVSSGDDMLLVKLMERSGPVADQLSNEVASDVLHAVSQFLLEQSLSDIALAWIQQFAEMIVENGGDIGIPLEVKREVLLSLHEASAMDPPEDWEGAPPDQMMIQLASAWGINIQQLIK